MVLVREVGVTDHQSACKKRRQVRVEILRRKRQRCSSPFQSEDSTTSKSSCMTQPCVLTKDEIRRKKNRESAERSRLRKLGRIDELTFQACELYVKHRDLLEENTRLRNMLSLRDVFDNAGCDDHSDDCSVSSSSLSPSLTSSSSCSSSRVPSSVASSPSHAGMTSNNYDGEFNTFDADDEASVSSLTCNSQQYWSPSPPIEPVVAISHDFMAITELGDGVDWDELLCDFELSGDALGLVF